MKQLLKWMGLVLFAAVVGLALAFTFNAIARSQTTIAAALRTTSQETPYSKVQQGGYNGWGMGPGMMGTQGQAYAGSGIPILIDQAIESVHQYLAAYANPDLEITEVMEFSNNFYAEVKEKSTNIHAFEVLVDRYTGVVYPEPGPNMMWNLRYGHMGGMMRGWGRNQTGSMSVTLERARDIAQQWLNKFLLGTSAAQEADAFYGYYTIHVIKDNQIYGMLSVNGYTGDVWYHTWHGNFIEIKELE